MPIRNTILVIAARSPCSPRDGNPPITNPVREARKPNFPVPGLPSFTYPKQVASACSLVGVLVVLRMPKNSNNGSCVFVIDNDASLRATLKELFESVGLHVELFASGRSFLENRNPNTTSSCLVLDVRLPGMSGLQVQEELAKAKISTPIIFLTGHGDIPIAVRAMKAGAVEFLTKPFRDQDLLDAVSTALEQDRARRAKEQSNSTLRKSFESLSARERDVVARVAAGGLNKQIAADLGLSEVTVKVHRAKAVRKLRAKSVSELVRMVDLLECLTIDDR